MTRTRTFAFIAAAAALIAFPVAAPALADQLKRESASVDGRPVPSSDEGDRTAVPPAPRADLKLDAVESAKLEQLQAKLEFMQQYEQLRADATADAAAVPPAPVDPAANASGATFAAAQLG